MMKLAEIIAVIDGLCPFSLQEPWDNSGFQLGDPNAEITAVLTALDLTEEVIREAKAKKAELIVTHHPLFFRGVTAIDGSLGKGKMITELIRSGIAVVSCHTNLDKAADGVSAVLGQKLGLTLCCPFRPDESGGCFGVIGMFPQKATLETFAAEVKERLSLPMIRVVGDMDRPVRTVAAMGGAGADFISDAADVGVDVYVTADLKYHDGQTAAERGLALIDAGHFPTEAPVMRPFTEKMAAAMPELRFSVADGMKDFWRVM
ncbi:MAG: Nif3-like dinuclear metal center hexameric protein [Bacillota bacterium]|jgi:dinuclear metal center YbgI/SA1388 family protein